MQRVLTRITAHQAACKAGVLHGNLSPGNIMLIDSETGTDINNGMLINWDLSKATNPSSQGRPNALPCWLGCTVSKSVRSSMDPEFLTCHQGTWQFMAADLVMNPKVTQTKEHDLESVFWILLWMCLSYMKTIMPPGLRADILNNIMSPRVHDGSGGMGKANFMASGISLKYLMAPNCPMADLLKALHRLLGKLHQSPQDLPSASPALDMMQSEAEHTVEGATVDAARRDKVKHEA